MQKDMVDVDNFDLYKEKIRSYEPVYDDIIN